MPPPPAATTSSRCLPLVPTSRPPQDVVPARWPPQPGRSSLLSLPTCWPSLERQRTISPPPEKFIRIVNDLCSKIVSSGKIIGLSADSGPAGLLTIGHDHGLLRSRRQMNSRPGRAGRSGKSELSMTLVLRPRRRQAACLCQYGSGTARRAGDDGKSVASTRPYDVSLAWPRRIPSPAPGAAAFGLGTARPLPRCDVLAAGRLTGDVVADVATGRSN